MKLIRKVWYFFLEVVGLIPPGKERARRAGRFIDEAVGYITWAEKGGLPLHTGLALHDLAMEDAHSLIRTL